MRHNQEPLLVLLYILFFAFCCGYLGYTVGVMVQEKRDIRIIQEK